MSSAEPFSPTGPTIGKEKKDKHIWKHEEDIVLVNCMGDLHNIGTYNADTGFKSGYLYELEKMVAKKLPNNNIKAKPHIESRIKTLKKDWAIVFDMITGKGTSGFGWDPERNVVIAEKPVWDDYLAAHPDAKPFQTRSFPFYEQMCKIYAKDRATGVDSQTAADIIEEIEREHREKNGDMSEIGASSKSGETTKVDRAESIQQAKKRKRSGDDSDTVISTSIINAATLLGDDMKAVGKELSKSIGTEMLIQEKVELLYAAIEEIDGLSDDEKDIALSKLPDHPAQMLVFFSLPMERRLRWVKRFLGTHN